MPRKPKADTPAATDDATSAAPPKRTRKKKADTATAAPEPAVAAEKPKRARKPRGPSVTTKRKQPTRWRHWLALEALTWLGGAATGVAIAGAVLVAAARDDIQARLASPPQSTPGTVWSGSMTIHEGQHVTVRELAGDLLAGGYERVERLDASPKTDRAGLIALRPDGLDIWTSGGEIAGRTYASARTRIIVNEGRVTDIDPGTKVTLRPTVLATVGDREATRVDVRLDAISPHVIDALLAMEDSRFHQHYGFDPVGLTRASVANVLGRRTQGGSTITQQLVKNLFLTPERSLRRKAHEAIYAIALESLLDKDKILAMYLREVYLGQMGGVPLYGVEQASRAWFGVSAKRLTPEQAATIVGVIPSPNQWSPTRHPEKSLERRDLVLARLGMLGKLTGEQVTAAKARGLEIRGELPGAVRRAPWAVDMAIEAAEHAVGEGALAGHGYQVFTTIDPALQRAAERAVREGLAELDAEYPKAAGAQAALVAVRVSDGAIVAMVGSRDYLDSPFNRANAAWRQAGSTVKPLTMLAAFDADSKLTPLTAFDDSPIARRIDGKPWTPRNYDGKFVGDISLRHAIEGSRNIPAILLAESIGATKLQRFYERSGLSRASKLPSASLGSFAATPLELAGAYTAFPGGGTAHRPWLVGRVYDVQGATVVQLAPEAVQLASARAAALSTHVLRGVITDGTGARAGYYGVHGAVGGKTGTTDDYRDAWFVGFTPDLVVAVWVGNDRGTLGLSGSRAALPAWSRFIAALGPLPTDFAKPSGVTAVTLCTADGTLAKSDCCDPTYVEWFVDGTQPTKRCSKGPIVEVGELLGGLFRRKRRLQDGEEPTPE